MFGSTFEAEQLLAYKTFAHTATDKKDFAKLIASDSFGANLDAHAHLGNLIFDHIPGDAMRHYEVGLRIGELSLGSLADGLLPWGWLDNRPFLRCMHGFGLCLWRLEQFEEAERVFDRLLWLNPADNQGVRFNIASVRARRTWEENE